MPTDVAAIRAPDYSAFITTVLEAERTTIDSTIDAANCAANIGPDRSAVGATIVGANISAQHAAQWATQCLPDSPTERATFETAHISAVGATVVKSIVAAFSCSHGAANSAAIGATH